MSTLSDSIYRQGLASYYDLLFNDEEGQSRYADYVRNHLAVLSKKPQETSLLELACGSGLLACLLAEDGYEVDASDLSEDMIDMAVRRAGNYERKPRFFPLDMAEFRLGKTYDAILCFCDSINYLREEKQIASLFRCAYEHLNTGGMLLFDCHSMDRLKEFAVGYEEADYLDDLEYQWTIQSVNDELHQHLQIWDDGNVPPLYVEEHHVQKVYSSAYLIETLKKAGFSEIEIMTDFDLPGITKGEKQFYCCRRKQ